MIKRLLEPTKTSKLQLCLRILLGAFMLYAGIGHLTFLRTEFIAQVPVWISTNPGLMDFIVLASGVIEIVLGASMVFLGRYKAMVGFLLALFYVVIFPGNINQYVEGISAFGLDTDAKRFVRLFFQPVLIIWALWSSGALKVLLNKNR